MSPERGLRAFRDPRLAGWLAAIMLFAPLVPASAAAEELSPSFIAEQGDAKVTKVIYEGNKRTRESALAELTGISVGMPLSDIDPEALRQRVLKSGIFSAVELSAAAEGEEAVLTVSVKEKWTFIPIPAASFGSEGWSVGLTLLEYNFLGLRKSLVLSGSDSNLGLGGILAYSDPRFLGTKASFRVFASARSAAKEAKYMDGSSYASYDETNIDGGLSFQYPSEGKLNAQLDLTLRHSGLKPEAALAYGLYEDSLVLVPGLAVNFDGKRSVGYRNAGASAYATYTHGFRIKGLPDYDSLDASAEASFSAFLGGYLELGAVGRYSSRPFQAQAALSGLGYRTLPQGSSFSPRNMAAYANLMLPILRLGWSVMELGPFYEGGAYGTGLSGDTVEVFHGPGLGFRLYLRDIALPAVEIAAAYNLPTAKFVASVNIGVSF